MLRGITASRPLQALALASLSGLILFFCFPAPDQGWLAWVALVPLLKMIQFPELKPGRLFLLGWWSGCLRWGGILFWIIYTCRTSGVSWTFSITAWASLSIYLAL